MNIRPHLAFLKVLSTVPRTQIRDLIERASVSDIKNISEICLNILSGVVPVSPDVLERLREHKRFLRRVAYKSLHKSPKKLKRYLMQQKGEGILTSVVPILLSVLLDLFKSSDGETN